MTSNQTTTPSPNSPASFIPLDRIGSVLTGQILGLPAIRSQRKRKAALGRVVKALQILGLAPTGLVPHRVVLGITTLYFFGWLYNIYQGWLNGERSDVDIIQFPSYINPRFDMEEYEDARKEMPDDEFSMTYQGAYHCWGCIKHGNFMFFRY